MWDQGQGQDQAHSQPLDLSLQSSASTTLYLMESHKLEEKRFSSKIGKWDKLLRPIHQNLDIYYQAQHPPFVSCIQKWESVLINS